jgi:hypothetical protein
LWPREGITVATTQLYVRLLLGLAFIIAAVACGEPSGSLSPTGVSPRSSSSGARIVGRVTGATSRLSPDIDPALATSNGTTSIRVTIAGTNISTEVNGSGNVSLEGVPLGTVTIRFTGEGISASITLTGVQANETINIEVTLNGNNARINSERRNRDDDDDDVDDDDRNDNEIEGPVSSLTGTCPALVFRIRDNVVTTTGGTVFQDPCTRVQNNVIVEVHGIRQPDQTLRATRLEIED